MMFIDGEKHDGYKARRKLKDDDALGEVVIMRAMTDLNGENLEFLTTAVNDLIKLVNIQNKEIKHLTAKAQS